MFQGWRLAVREAREAMKSGRLEEAGELLTRDDVREFLPARKLLAQVAQEVAKRGQARVKQRESTAGWRDLDVATRWGADETLVAQLRQQLVQSVLVEAESYLEARDPRSALSRLDVLEQRNTVDPAVRQLRQIAFRLLTAQSQAARGEFPEALEKLEAAEKLRPDLKFLADWHREVLEKSVEVRKLEDHLHQALASEDWLAVRGFSQRLLELAPHCEVAQKAHRKAWKAVGAPMQEKPRRWPLPETLQSGEKVASAEKKPDKRNNHDWDSDPSPRFLMWVDGVGGYLVCEGEEVVFGPPLADGRVDVAVQGDLSRSHAAVRRCGEGYLLVPRRETYLDGEQITEPAPLADGKIIQLGDTVQIRFRKPHALSSTARLEIISRHRTQPPVDAVLLLADTCILGPNPNAHVVCRRWDQEVVLFRKQGELACRTKGVMEIDGEVRESSNLLTRNSRVSGEDFAFSLEEMPRIGTFTPPGRS